LQQYKNLKQLSQSPQSTNYEPTGDNARRLKELNIPSNPLHLSNVSHTVKLPHALKNTKKIKKGFQPNPRRVNDNPNNSNKMNFRLNKVENLFSTGQTISSPTNNHKAKRIRLFSDESKQRLSDLTNLKNINNLKNKQDLTLTR